MEQKNLLSVQDVMKMLNVSKRTIYNWIEKGELSAIRLGKLYRFHPEDIDRFIAEGRKKHFSKRPRKTKILLVDDDLLVRKSLKMLLEKSGFEVTVVENGFEAIEKAKNENYSLLLTDMRMPGMSGVDVIKSIRELKDKASEPVIPEIVISAYDDASSLNQIEELGVRDFILKPFNWEQFLASIQKSLN